MSINVQQRRRLVLKFKLFFIFFSATHGPLPYLIFDVATDSCEDLVASNPHYCVPKSINDIRGIQIRREELNKVKESREKPATVLVNIAAKVTEKYAARGANLVQSVKDAAVTNVEAVKKAASRVASSLYPKLKLISDLDETNPKHQVFFKTLKGKL